MYPFENFVALKSLGLKEVERVAFEIFETVDSSELSETSWSQKHLLSILLDHLTRSVHPFI